MIQDCTGQPGYEPFEFCHFITGRWNQIGPSCLPSGSASAYGFLIATRIQHFHYRGITSAPSVSWLHEPRLNIPEELAFTAEEIGQLCGGN